jgi:hypothetical protein
MKIPKRFAKRKVRVLESELQMLQRYKTDISMLYQEYEQEFIRDMQTLETSIIPVKPSSDQQGSATQDENEFEVLKIDPTSKEQRWKKTDTGWEREEINEEAKQKVEQKETKKHLAPDWAKKLYRKIATITHPDKTAEHYRKEKLNKIFVDAADAMEKGNFKDLLGYALELDIEPELESSESIPILKERIQTLKKEIVQIEKSIPWLWGEGLGVLDLRVKIAAAYFGGRGIKIDEKEIQVLIKEIEDADHV